LLVQLGLQQRAEVGGAGRSAGVGHALDRIGGFGVVASLDRQLDRTRLAVDVDDHGFDVFAGVQHGGGIFNAARGDLGSAQVAFNVHGQRNHSALGFDGLDGARNYRALVKRGDEVV